MLVDAILLIAAIGLVVTCTIIYTVIARPALRRWDAEQRRLENVRHVADMERELHLDQRGQD